MNKKFADLGYCVVKNAITPELRDFITQYTFFDEMQNESKDDIQVPNAFSKYADPAMETVLTTLLPTMEKETGLELDPTYSYYRIYYPGDRLEKHKDRPSCEISCILCFNYNYENYEWPIYMEGEGIVLEPGDMVIYKGMDLEHWRNTFDIKDDDAWHVQGFFHYVNKKGSCAEWKWDKRDSIGSLNKQTTTPSYIEYTK